MVLGIDIGGTSIKYGIVDSKGNILEKSSIETIHDKEIFLKNLFSLIENSQKKYTLQGIGISAPGIIEKDGFMKTAGAIMCLYETNLKKEVEEKFSLPTYIENDANCAAMAEKWIGEAQNLENYLFLSLGTGVGGGIVINNKIYRGAHGAAGEFGWMLRGSLPKKGPLEKVSFNAQASVVFGLIRYYNQLAKKNKSETTKDALFILNQGKEKNPIALKALDFFYENTSSLLLNLISSYDPEAIILGGGISSNSDFQEQVKERFLTMKKRHESLNYLSLQTPILIASLRNDAGLIGGAYLVYEKGLY